MPYDPDARRPNKRLAGISRQAERWNPQASVPPAPPATPVDVGPTGSAPPPPTDPYAAAMQGYLSNLAAMSAGSQARIADIYGQAGEAHRGSLPEVMQMYQDARSAGTGAYQQARGNVSGRQDELNQQMLSQIARRRGTGFENTLETGQYSAPSAAIATAPVSSAASNILSNLAAKQGAFGQRMAGDEAAAAQYGDAFARGLSAEGARAQARIQAAQAMAAQQALLQLASYQAQNQAAGSNSMDLVTRGISDLETNYSTGYGGAPGMNSTQGKLDYLRQKGYITPQNELIWNMILAKLAEAPDDPKKRLAEEAWRGVLSEHPELFQGLAG